MNDLPVDLVAVLPEGGVNAAHQWWSTLSETDRQRIAGLWDERLEVKFFTPQSDDHGHSDEWEQVPAVAGGRFMPVDDDGGVKEWGQDRFEYLLSNPELILAYAPEYRVFAICTQHAAARACIDNGRVPSDFQCPFESGACPFGSGACPMEQLRGAKLLKRGS